MPKPKTPIARADAKLKAHSRAAYPRFDADVTKYGRPTADYNAGFVAGLRIGQDLLAKAIRDALKTK